MSATPIPAADPAAAAPLEYPYPSLPERGQALAVVPGVLWLRMPLPFRLDHINLWAIDDGDAGWAVVDSGMRTDDTCAAWRTLFHNPPGPRRPISRVFITHMHPDHVGLAGWLTRKFNCRLWMTRLEYLNCRMLVADGGREAPDDGVTFYRRAGWDDAAIELYRARFGNYGQHIHALPDSYRRLVDGEEIQIGAERWRVVVGSGHSPEHACLYCPALKLLISGDQVLPRISSNVSVFPSEPDANPMAEWLASLDKLEREVPDDVLVLPAHNEPFRGLHRRLAQLRTGQLRTLDRLADRLAEPRRVVDVFVALFGREIRAQDGATMSLATGESVACLNWLLQAGRAVCEVDADGVAWYRG